MDQQYNIGNVIMDLDESVEDRIAIRTPESPLSYGALRHLTTCFALHLRERGVGRSSCVAISTADVRVAVASTLAIALLGGCWVQANRWSLANSALGITHVLHGGENDLSEPLSAIEIDESWTKFPDGIDPSQPIEFEGYASPDDTWMIAQSSGSTGIVRFMGLSYRLFLRTITARRGEDLVYHGSERYIYNIIMHPLGRSSIVGYSTALRCGGEIVSGGDYFFWKEMSVTEVHGTPAQLSAALSDIVDQANDRIPACRIIGSKTSNQLIALLYRFFDNVIIIYGATEVGGVADRILRNGEYSDGRLGRSWAGAVVQAVDGGGKTVEANVDGFIRVRSDIMIHQYIGDPEATAAAFRDGWFYPGDIGHLTEDGQLVITGRVTDILNLGGMKVNAVSIDEVIQAQAGVADGICFAMPDELGVDELAAIIALSDGADSNSVCNHIRATCHAELGAPYVPKYIYLTASVPRNERGKATRHLAIEAIKGMEPAWVLPSP